MENRLDKQIRKARLAGNIAKGICLLLAGGVVALGISNHFHNKKILVAQSYIDRQNAEIVRLNGVVQETEDVAEGYKAVAGQALDTSEGAINNFGNLREKYAVLLEEKFRLGVENSLLKVQHRQLEKDLRDYLKRERDRDLEPRVQEDAHPYLARLIE